MDQTPLRYSMMFPQGYSLSYMKASGVNAFTVKPDWYSVGAAKTQSPSGNTVTAYSIERTLCDLLRRRKQVDTGTISQAFRRYLDRPDKDISLLSTYASMFSVTQPVKNYLEILL